MNSQLSFINTLARLAANPGSEDLRFELAGLTTERGPSSRQLQQFLVEILRHTEPEIHLERDGHLVASFNLGLGGQEASHILPGKYLLRLSTGRVLWEDTLTESDLFRSIPDQLVAAATTDPSRLSVSREERLAGGAIILRVIPGYGQGTLRLEPGKEGA